MRDFDSIVKDKEIPWVRHWIDATFEFSKNFIKPGTTNEIDFEALGKEEWEFRKALKTKDFTSSKRAEYLWNEAIKLRDRNRANGSKGGRPRKNPQDAPNGNAGGNTIDTGNRGCLESATSCDQFTADGDVREDSHDGKSGTSANIYATRQAKNGDAATREGAEDCHHPINGAIARPTTVSNPFTTKNPSTISANGRRTGGPSLSQTSSLPPVRQSEPDVMSLAYSGEFQNVRLTKEQYAELGIKFGNQQKLNRAIDSLSCKLENGETNPRNHYAELVKWASYREDMEEQKIQQSEAPKMTEMEKSWIREAEKIARYEKELAANERR